MGATEVRIPLVYSFINKSNTHKKAKCLLIPNLMNFQVCIVYQGQIIKPEQQLKVLSAVVQIRSNICQPKAPQQCHMPWISTHEPAAYY
jgi:hypothetical protein